MRFLAVLNRSGGTLSSLDLAEFEAHITDTLETAGHSVEIETVDGEAIIEALRQAAASSDCDVVMAAGGDGTISAAASLLRDSGKALAILPAGTMNLFARSLKVPLDLNQAVEAFAHGERRKVDISTANGRPFIHQYSIGMHPQLINLREQMDFEGRVGKIFASARAAFTTFLRPPRMRLTLSMEKTEVKARSSSVNITNNLFGEGHLPYADDPAGGELGIYITRAKTRRDLLWLFLNMAVGRWKKNEQMEVHQTDCVTMTITSHHKRFTSAMDGELCPLEKVTEFRIHPGALEVLVPTATEAG